MAPKKAAAEASAAKKTDDGDTSCETFMRAYRKNCTTLGIDQCTEIKKLLEEEWVGLGKPISKVNSPLLNKFIDSYRAGDRLARRGCNF